MHLFLTLIIKTHELSRSFILLMLLLQLSNQSNYNKLTHYSIRHIHITSQQDSLQSPLVHFLPTLSHNNPPPSPTKMRQKEMSQSIISLMKPQTKSMLRSQQQLTSNKLSLPATSNPLSTILSSSPCTIPKKPSYQLRSIPKSRQSVPYRLLIKRVTNLPSISKKSNSSILFLHFTIKTFVRRRRDGLGEEVERLGEDCHYQCEEALFKRQEARHEYPVCFYYHSRVNKNEQAVFFAVAMRLLEVKHGIVENSHSVGFFIVENPFAQTQERGIPVCKQQYSKLQYIEYENYQQMSKGSQGAMVDYQIISAIELKRLTKLVPENTVISTNSIVPGLLDQFLPNDPSITEIIESSHINIKLKYLQVHIPNTFEESVLGSIKGLPGSGVGAKEEIKSRKVVVGLLAGRNLVGVQERRLEMVEREDAGDYKLTIYQALKDGETINYPYYIEETADPLVFCLVYQVGDKQFQSGYYAFCPTINGQTHDISEQMLISANQLSPISQLFFIKSTSKHKPTFISEYMSEQLLEDQSFIQEMSTKKAHPQMKSSQSFMRSSHKIIQDKTQQLKQKDKLLQQIQYQKMCLQKQRTQIQKLKTDNYIMYQEEFERRFDEEKEALARRQELLENQYREQVEREIREKNQLEEQILEMKEKVRRIEQENEDRRGVEGVEVGGGERDSYQYQQPYNPTSLFNTQPRSQFAPPPHYPQHPREKIDPSYLLQTQNQIPITKVRQLLTTQNRPQINKELISLSKNQFHRASKFMFTFTSINWNDNVTRPKEVFFVIRFFNFGEFRTDRLGFQGGDGGNQKGYCKLVRVHQYNCGREDATPTYTFTVDPSEYKNSRNIQQDLTSYLCHNNCIVDIFDGVTHIYLGQINIKLSELIRGTKSQIFIAKEYNLVKIKTKQHLGVIQVVVKNEQAMCNKDQYRATNTTNATKDEKKKVVSYAPMVIPKNQNAENLNKVQRIPTSNKNMTANRAQQRIKQYKQRQQQKKLSDLSANFQSLPQKEKHSTLANIEQYKQKNMNEYIKTIYSSLLHENITINAEFGKAETFPYTFVNQGNSSCAYKVVIDWTGGGKGEEGRQKQCDLEVVKEASEWRYYVKKKGYMQPKFYETINDSNVFYLNSGQSLTMVFKYLTFRPVPKYHSQQVLINVSIVKIDSNWIAGGFSLTVELHQQVVHHSYVLYEPGNQLIELVMPVIYTREEEYGPGGVKKLFITDQDGETEAQWLNEYEILLKVLTPAIMQRKTFNILLYDDEYFDQLKENWLIVLNSYQGVWAQCRMDYSTKIKLALPMSIIPQTLGHEFNSSILANYLKLNSSDTSIVIENDRILAEFSKMREGGAFEVWCEILSNKGTKKEVEITCTSEEGAGLVYGWIVQVFPYSAKRN